MEETIIPLELAKKPDKDRLKAFVLGVGMVLWFVVTILLVTRVFRYWDGRIYGPITLVMLAGGLVGMHIFLQFLVVRLLKIQGSFKQAVSGALMFFVFNVLAGGAWLFLYSFAWWILLGMAVLALISAIVAVHIIKKVYGLENAPAIFVTVDEILFAVILNYAIYSVFMLVM